jgi:hypothetical protein
MLEQIEPIRTLMYCIARFSYGRQDGGMNSHDCSEGMGPIEIPHSGQWRKCSQNFQLRKTTRNGCSLKA